MIRINLLPFRAARRRENVRRQTSIFFLSVVLVAIGLFYYHLTLAGRITALNQQADTLEAELKKKRKAAREVDKIKKTAQEKMEREAGKILSDGKRAASLEEQRMLAETRIQVRRKRMDAQEEAIDSSFAEARKILEELTPSLETMKPWFS